MWRIAQQRRCNKFISKQEWGNRLVAVIIVSQPKVITLAVTGEKKKKDN